MTNPVCRTRCSKGACHPHFDGGADEIARIANRFILAFGARAPEVAGAMAEELAYLGRRAEQDAWDCVRNAAAASLAPLPAFADREPSRAGSAPNGR